MFLETEFATGLAQRERERQREERERERERERLPCSHVLYLDLCTLQAKPGAHFTKELKEIINVYWVPYATDQWN